VQLCIDLNVNFLGFVFYEKSPRNTNLDDIKILSKYNKKNSSFVAVTVNPTNEFIEKNIIRITLIIYSFMGQKLKKELNEIKNIGS
jgi:phosphoribosylanthranilate isomerase